MNAPLRMTADETTGCGWSAGLALDYAWRGERTVLARRQHNGPLVVQKTLHPEGDAVCHSIILHPPGGVAGGDRLKLAVQVGEKAQVLLTTPGAGKWYKANGRQAIQQTEMVVGEGTQLEWLPQENMLYNEAAVDWSSRIELAATARFAAWEVTCLGRRARGERFEAGHWRQQMQVYRAGRRVFTDFTDVAGGSRLLLSPVGLAGMPVSGVFLIAAGKLPDELLSRCREVMPDDSKARYGMTVLPEVTLVRYVGIEAQAARLYFEKIWGIVRPWYGGRPAVRPRIWNT